MKCQYGDTLPDSHLVISLTLTTPVSCALELPFHLLQHGSQNGCFVPTRHQFSLSGLNFKVRRLTTRAAARYLPLSWERSLPPHLATHLLLRLNPKREAAAPILCPPKAPAAPRLRFCAFGGEEPPQERQRHYGFVCCSYKHQLELDLRYT